MNWKTLQREATDLAFAGSHEAAAERLHRAISSLDFSRQADRIIAGRLRSDLSWVFSNDGQYVHALFAAQRSMAGLANDPDAIDAYCWAANSAATAAWQLYGPAECARFAESGLKRKMADRKNLSHIEAKLRGNLGLALHTIGRHEEAIVELRHSLEMFQALNAVDDVAAGQRRLANAYQDAGHLSLSAVLMRKSRPDKSEKPLGRAAWLNGSALLYERQGRFLDAAAAYDEAVLLFSDLGDQAVRVAAILSNAALLDIDLGRPNTARTRAAEIEEIVASGSAPLSSRVGLQRIRAALALAEDDKERALLVWQSAAELFERDADGDPAQLGEIQTYIANLQLGLGRHDDATASLDRYLTQFDVGLPVYAVQPAVMLAQLWLNTGARDDAIALLSRALEAELGRREPEQLWRVYSGLADALAESASLSSAILLGKLAVDQVHETSKPLESDRTALQSYIHQRLVPHRRLIDRLATAARLPEAMHVQRRVKFEQLAEIVRRDRSLTSRFQPVPKTAREEATANKLDALSRAIVEARDGTVDWRLLPKQRSVCEKRLKELRNQSNGVIQELLRPKPEHEASSRLAPRFGDDDGLVIRFVAGSTTLTALVSRAGELVAEVPIEAPIPEISRRVFELLTAIDLMQPIDQPARWLYDALLRPMSSWMDRATDVEVVCDGPLAYVPFACLRSERAYLIETHSIAIRTGIAPRRKPRRRLADWRTAAFTNAAAVEALPPLVFAERERQELERHAPNLVSYSNAEFTEGALLEAFSRFEHLHLATHFALVPASVHRSLLYLGSGDTIDLAGLRRAVPDMSHVELLVLSCCDTGSRDQGELGPDSFAAVTHSAGAGDVVATLWPVSDASTAQLMGSFYERLFAGGSGTSVATALRNAQLALLHGKSGDSLTSKGRKRGLGAPTTKESNWTHPYYWAGVTHFVTGG